MAEHRVEKEQEREEEVVPERRRDGVVTVVLTADNHLGYAAFGQHPRKREERQQNLRRAFQQATDFAIVQGVDLFIQVGDLFDTTAPDERDRSFVAARLAQLKQAGVHTFALGGVH
ncbi:MAG: metallophosphoesterase, partial [Ktedonobacteraceae bacterium]|nr:metallophosphoesterase [Ktedonobacteraceae bacterium]